MNSDPEGIIDPQSKRKEVKLELEISDIIDELNSINRVFEAQKDTLETAVNVLNENDSQGFKNQALVELGGHLKSSVIPDIEGYMKQLKRTTADAQRTKDNVR